MIMMPLWLLQKGGGPKEAWPKYTMKVKRQANEIRQKELELKAEELKQNQMFLQNILAQQQQFHQQEQAMNQAFLNALANLVNKD